MMETNRIGGRPRDPFTDRHVVIIEDNEGKAHTKKCIYCGHQFSIKTSVTRIKAHLSRAPGHGVAPCKHVPFNVTEAARTAMPSSCSNLRSDANIPSSSDTQRPPPQECCTSCPPSQTIHLAQEQSSGLLDGSSQHCNVDSICFDMQLNPLEGGSVILEGLESQEGLLNLSQVGTQQPSPLECYSSDFPLLQSMLLNGSPQQTNNDYTCWDEQFNLSDMAMQEGLESQENFQSYYTNSPSQIGPMDAQQCFMADESSLPQETLTSQEVLEVPLITPQPNESCSTNDTMASQHTMQQRPGEDPNCLPYQGVLRDATRMDSTHDATIPENFLQEGGACPEGLESQHHVQENLQRNEISSLNHDLDPSTVPQPYHTNLDLQLESLNAPACTSNQDEHAKKRKLPNRSPIGKKLPLATTFQGPTFDKKVEEINASLTDDFVSRIGVYGMGGIGKTTIMKHIHNLLLEGHPMAFSQVIWVTVSQNHTITKLQNHLASRFNVILPHSEDEVARAAALYERMQNESYALILDDVWEEVNFEQVGIPEPSCDNRCQLIITTRSLDVCNRMRCKPISLDLLSEGEAWDLFVLTLGVPSGNSIIQGIMTEVAKKCARLPLSIVTVAGSMRGVDDVYAWRNALNSLTKHTIGLNDMEKKVIETLKFSYHRLTEQLQECLLVCALFPEDWKIYREDLTKLLISMGIIGSTESLLSAYDHGYTILDQLVKACLLIRGSINSFGEVLMHDLIRDMCIDIARGRFLVKCQLEVPPNESEYTKEMEKVSLIGSKFEEISPDMVPYCPKLSTLLLSQNRKLTKISYSFFMGLPRLQVLDLSDTSIRELPDSITNLVSLNALILQRCRGLRHLPCLAPIKELKKLDVRKSGIEEAPEGLEELIHLTYLDFGRTKIRTLPVLRNLVKLQHLDVGRAEITIDDVKELKNLEIFSGIFSKLEEFNQYVNSLLNSKRGPAAYDIAHSCYAIRRTKEETIGIRFKGMKDEEGSKKNCTECMSPRDVGIIIPSHELVKTLSVYDSSEYGILSKLARVTSTSQHMLSIHFHREENTEESGQTKGLFDAKLLTVFPNITELRVSNSTAMEELISTSPSREAFKSSLKLILISECNKFVRLLAPKFLSYFHNLETMHLIECVAVESLIFAASPIEKEESDAAICFPKLRYIILGDLKNLRSIYDGPLICPSIETIHVRRCPKLKRLPLPRLFEGDSPLQSSLKVICGEETWWESLEWDHPRAKTLLEHCFKPCIQNCYASFILR